ncbi:MAG: ribose 5-phosphate isomerase A [Candidatus Diapherotrites archaeon]|nr:ribose 5-phosphate isomerase A [Candidatus Diapherotrites archaeon]
MPLDERIIEAIAERYIQDGMILAVGTGPQNITFLRQMALKAQEKNYKISLVPTSVKLAEVASSLKMKISSINDTDIDLSIEFADIIDKNFNFISRLTTSLVRDKMVGQSAAEMLVVAKESNYVKRLYGSIPYEVDVFGAEHSLVRLDQFGKAAFRLNKNGEKYVTETGNYVVDVDIDKVYDLEDLEYETKEVPGVIESGLFIDYADRVLLYNGKIHLMSRIGPELKAKDE